MSRHPSPFVLVLALLASCSSSTADPCVEAAAHIDACFGTELMECNESIAEGINSRTCEEIANAADVEGKADGWCPRYLWWLCGDADGVDCPAAGHRSEYGRYSNVERMNYHWELMACTEYGVGENPPLERSTFDVVADAASGVISTNIRLNRAFTNTTDELDRGRTKLIHPVGSVAQLRLDHNPDPDPSCNVEYTGLWGEDGIVGLGRLGWGADPRAFGYLPGMAIKFFIEGRDSTNLHSVAGMEGDHDLPNFFHQTPSNVNHVTSAFSGVLHDFLALFVDQPIRIGLDHSSQYWSDGTRVESPHAPWEVAFVPTDEAIAIYDAALEVDPRVDFREVFAAMDIGTPLYHVVVTEEEGACEQTLGTLSNVTEFRASRWGDRHLYFQHSTEGQGLD